MIGRCHVDRVDIGAGEHLAEIVVRLAVGILVVFVGFLLGRLADAPADIADGHVLDVRAAEESALVSPAHVADADAAHHDPLARRRHVGIAQGG